MQRLCQYFEANWDINQQNKVSHIMEQEGGRRREPGVGKQLEKVRGEHPHEQLWPTVAPSPSMFSHKTQACFCNLKAPRVAKK